MTPPRFLTFVIAGLLVMAILPYALLIWTGA